MKINIVTFKLFHEEPIEVIIMNEFLPHLDVAIFFIKDKK